MNKPQTGIRFRSEMLGCSQIQRLAEYVAAEYGLPRVDRTRVRRIDFVSGRALRELEPAAQMYAKVMRLSELAAKGQTIPDDAKFTISEAMDTMIRWFCILFQNQFTPDDVLDNYPVDRLMHDIALALMAVQAQTTDVLSDFPTTAATEPAQTPES